ncbi:hypothetical protein [Variovorax boronicumulans]|uniref:hypothetical protein n=1 Tax=Variovorax boronicumulans TaxID=436515 RepID=UPI0013304356|nr:hypothetical protein [Variovorax boronicumulans]
MNRAEIQWSLKNSLVHSRRHRARDFPYFRVLILALLFRAILDVGYVGFVVPIFGYDGFVYEMAPLRYAISLLAIGIAIWCLMVSRKSVLIYVYYIVFLLVILPATTFYALGGANQYSFFANLIVYCALVFFLPRHKGEELKNDLKMAVDRRVIYTSIAFILFCAGFLLISSGGNFVLGFEDVYEFRAENTQVGIFAYFTNWATKLVAPFLLASAIVRGGMMRIGLALMVIFLLYALTGHKSVLAPIGLCAIAYFFNGGKSGGSRNAGVNPGFFLASTGALLAFTVLIYATYVIYENVLFPSVFFRRTYFTPAFLNSVYFEMFSRQGFVYWSNSFLSPFIDYPYADTITHEVGAYLGRDGMGANTGFVASGFMQAGYLGVAIYFIAVASLNYFVARFGSRVNPVIFNSILFMPYLTLFSSSDLPTTILTHGLGLAAILLAVLSKKVKIKGRSFSRPSSIN